MAAEEFTHADLVDALRDIGALRPKGKTRETFHHRSRPFLHFHVGPHGEYADVRFDDEWEAVPAADAEQRRRLLERVRRHVEHDAAPRRR